MRLWSRSCMVVLAVVVSAMAAGCGSSGGGESAEGGGKVFTSSPIDVSTGDIFTISLESNPSTGYTWELSGPLNDAVVVSLGSDHRAGEGSAVGVAGHQLFMFKAVGKGSTTIGLQYVRPWETGVAPAETSDFEVSVS